MLFFSPCWGMITSLQLSLTVLWWVYATVHEWLMYCSSRQLLSLPHSSYRGHWFAISPGVMLHTQVSLFTTRYSIFCVPRTSIVVESHCVAPGSKSACIKYSASVALSTSTVFLWTAVFISMQAEWRRVSPQPPAPPPSWSTQEVLSNPDWEDRWLWIGEPNVKVGGVWRRGR